MLFSSMTSFTQCSGTSFTLLRERSERGGAIKDDVEECGYSGTTRAVRRGGESAGEDFRGSLSGVRGLSTHGIFVAAALSGTGTGRHRRAQPAAACQSAADRRGVGAARSWNCGQRYPDWGARKLQVLLRQAGVRLPASTIHRILWRRGLVGIEDRHAAALQRVERAEPNQLWQMDFKGSTGWKRRWVRCRCSTITAAI